MPDHGARSMGFVGLGAFTVAGLAFALLGAPSDAPAAPTSSRAAPAVATERERQPTASPSTRSTPTPERLRIPTIGVATRVTRLGLNPDRTVEVPARAQNAGWYQHGPPPGQLGSAVILGHVDSKTGPAVFYRLPSLRRGDRIHVRLSDGATAHFRVTSVNTYPNDAFPARQVYAGNPAVPSLNLVTCGGEYDAERGGYQSNVVVHAEHSATDDPGT